MAWSNATVAPRLQGLDAEPNGAARAGRFSLHAGVDIASHQREELERPCRYVSRPPVASERRALTASGQVRYMLKTPYRDGTTHIVLEPLERSEVAECCLNHMLPGIQGVYNRHDYLAERRAALETWTALLLEIERGARKVAPLRLRRTSA